MNFKIIRDWIDQNGPQGMEKLAVQAGISIATVIKVARGHVPRLEIIRKLAKAVGVTLDELLRVDSERPPAA